ncbi:unnamed protein product [Sphagnum tenellum]
MAQDLLSHGANINSRDPSSGQTVLALAARLGDVEMVEYLLDHRADAGLTAFTGTSVLHAAALDRGAEERQREVSRILIRHGVVLNSRNSLRETPLFVAARSGNTGMVRDLLEAGADPHLTDYAGQTALFDAAGGGELGAVQALLSAGVDINRQPASRLSSSSDSHQAAGQMALNENFLKGGSLQRGLVGNEKPQEFIEVETGSEVPNYVTREFTVQADDIISVELHNNSQVGHIHDWALIKPGTLKKVERLAKETSSTWDWIPETSDILAVVPMTKPGESSIRLFRAPDQPGDYPFLCTYPGHGMAMNGVLHVVDAVKHDKE